MAQPLVFISYKHENPTTKIAKQLYDALQTVADGLGIEGVFMDVNAIENDPLVKRLGDVQFLGPFDANQRLVRLAWENEAELGDQIASLIDGLERTLKQRTP